MTLEIEQLTPVIGAEIHGADLLHQDANEIALIREALFQHQVIFLRDQDRLPPQVQIDFARHFGPLHYHPAAPHLEGFPEVFVIHTDKSSQIANGNGWHTDVSCDEQPPMATMLQIHQLPDTGGDTLFSSMFAAFETLSEPMQTFLSTLTATHASEHIYRGRYSDRGVEDKGKTYPSSIHPVVRTHPDSSRQALYVNPSFTTRINELKPRESEALLNTLYAHQQRNEFQIRFRWSRNAIAMWDNRATQHFAMWDYWPSQRTGHRVTVQGERPFFRPAGEYSRPTQIRLSGQRLGK